MRSKEVEEAIKNFEGYNEMVRIKNPIDVTIVNPKDFKKDIEIVLSYIEELEKMIPTPSNEVPVEWQTSVYVDKRDYVSKQSIRDKIKELEDLLKLHQTDTIEEDICSKLEVLKSIIGEQEYEK